MERFRRRLCILLTLGLVLTAVVPAMAFGARPRPSAITTDAWESDDTSETARSLPELSFHTLKGQGTQPDQDWSVQTVEETGAPLLVDVSQRLGWCLPLPMMFVEDDESPDGLAGVTGPSIIWGGIGLPSNMMVRAPVAGRYFTGIIDAYGPFAGGAYHMQQKRGLAFRLGGSNRFETAVRVSRQMWPAVDQDFDAMLTGQGAYPISSPAGCVLTTGRGFADALAASAWISRPGVPETKYPILLTERDHLPETTLAEIYRLAGARRKLNLPFTVYVVGGESAVGSGVISDLGWLNHTHTWNYPISDVVRIAGPDRFATASAVASEAAKAVPGLGDTVFIVNGFSFADALSAGPVASKALAPLLLVRQGSVPEATAKWITDHPQIKRAVVVGSSSVVASSVVESLSAPPFSLVTTRVFGPDRYATSRAVVKYGIERYPITPASLVVVTGEDYPDGLSAAGLTAFTNGPLLLTPRSTLSPYVEEQYDQFPTMLPSYVVGGEAAVSAGTMAAFDDLWRHAPLGPTGKP